MNELERLFNDIEKLIKKYVNNKTYLKYSGKSKSIDMSILNILKVLNTKNKTLLILTINKLDDEIFDIYNKVMQNE